MAQDITTAEGIEPDANYPKGVKILDNQTIVNAKINQDIIQFFWKIMRNGLVSPNGLDDNEANGYQFIEAFIKSLKYAQDSEVTGLLASLTTAGLVELATLAQVKAGTDSETHVITPYPLVVQPSSLVAYTRRISVKKINITAWNMDTTEEYVFNHGLTATELGNMLSFRAEISSNAPEILPVDFINTNLVTQGSFRYNSTNMTLIRLSNGIFDSSNYNNATGFVLITYIPD